MTNKITITEADVRDMLKAVYIQATIDFILHEKKGDGKKRCEELIDFIIKNLKDNG